jgi:hypothetical protein
MGAWVSGRWGQLALGSAGAGVSWRWGQLALGSAGSEVSGCWGQQALGSAGAGFSCRCRIQLALESNDHSCLASIFVDFTKVGIFVYFV